MAVLVIFPLLAFGLVTWLSQWDGLSGIELPAFTDSDDGAPGDADGPTGDGDDAEGAGGDGDPTPGAEQTPTDEETATPPPEPEPVADLGRTVVVLNSTRISGLAAGGAGKLETAGFTDVSTGNWSGDDVAASIVYYELADDVTTAQQVAGTLGVTAVELSPTVATDGVVAVLAEDYVP